MVLSRLANTIPLIVVIPWAFGYNIDSYIIIEKRSKMNSFNNTGLRKIIIDEIIYLAKKCDVDKVLLFGSRARGDYKERSDIDIAFSGGNSSYFITMVNEEISTLLQFDIVDLNLPIQKELLSSINKEGIIIYEKV